MKQVFRTFAQSHETMSYEELHTFAAENNKGIIYWEPIMEVMDRISKDEFVRKGLIRFNVSATDEVLEMQMNGCAYMPLQSFNLFLQYPSANVKWNSFVLESYVAGYSQTYQLIHANYTATKCGGAIVRRDASIHDFDELLLDVLANNASWKNKNDAFSLLIDRGYLQRKSYTKMDAIVRNAKLRRENQQTK